MEAKLEYKKRLPTAHQHPQRTGGRLPIPPLFLHPAGIPPSGRMSPRGIVSSFEQRG